MAAESLNSPRPPEPYDGSGCACGTINNNLARVRAQSHFEQSTNDFKMGRGKRAGRWRAVVWPHLHIDDGSMGGGGPIPHHNYMTFDDTDGNHPNYVNFYDDFKDNGYFSPERDGIFHYCIFSHYCWAQNPGEPFNKDRAGRSFGDDFVVCESQSKYTFMHELGHTLDLDHSKDKDGTFNYPNDYSTEKDAKKSVMYHKSADATNGYTYGKLWKYIDLT